MASSVTAALIWAWALAAFEDCFLPQLEAAAWELKDEFPGVLIRVYGSSSGSRTDLQGHDLSIDCLLPDVPADRPDNVALGISLKHLSTTPLVASADVCWGHPSGRLEAELDIRDVPYGGAAVDTIEQGLPGLLAALRAALKRGAPSS